jgi:hypothetical protein
VEFALGRPVLKSCSTRETFERRAMSRTRYQNSFGAVAGFWVQIGERIFASIPLQPFRQKSGRWCHPDCSDCIEQGRAEKRSAFRQFHGSTGWAMPCLIRCRCGGRRFAFPPYEGCFRGHR